MIFCAHFISTKLARQSAVIQVTLCDTILHYKQCYTSTASLETDMFHPSRKSELLQNVLFFDLLQVPVLHHWFCTVSKISLLAYSFPDLHLIDACNFFEFHPFGESVFHYHYTEVCELILQLFL